MNGNNVQEVGLMVETAKYFRQLRVQCRKWLYIHRSKIRELFFSADLSLMWARYAATIHQNWGLRLRVHPGLPESLPE